MSELRESFFALKIATTLDRCIATHSGDSKWITSHLARQEVARLRKQFDAVAVSSRTVMADNPSLTIRIDGQEESCSTRMVFDPKLSLLKTFEKYKLFTDRFQNKTILLISDQHGEILKEEAREKGLSFYEVPTDKNGRLSFSACKKILFKNGVNRVFIEGGANLSQVLFDQKVLDYLYLFIAPKILGDERSLRPFPSRGKIFQGAPVYRKFGQDFLLEGAVENGSA